MAEQFHQGVDADVGVGIGERGRNPWTSAPRARSASMPARRNARSTRYCRVPRVMRSPSAPTNSGAVDGQAANPPPGEERSCGGGSLDVHRLKYAPCIVARPSVSAEVQIPAGASC